MAYFYEWETVDVTISLDRENALVDVEKAVVSFGQIGGNVLSKSDDLELDTEANTITVHLNQDETGKLSEGETSVQINLYYDTGERDTSDKAYLFVRDNLYKEELS